MFSRAEVCLHTLSVPGVQLGGLSIFSYFVSAVSQSIKLLNAHSLRMAETRQEADMMIRMHRLPQNLALRIKSYYKGAHSSAQPAW
jgi:hypothetical protein